MLKEYRVRVNKHNFTLHAQSWMHAFRMCTAGQKGGVPRDLRIIPNYTL